MKRPPVFMAVLLGLAMLGGCAATGGGAALRPDHDSTASALVLPTTAFLDLTWDDAGGWEHGRRDDALGIGSARGRSLDRRVEIRTVDRRWTSSGRVREHSRTTTRTIERGILRSE